MRLSASKRSLWLLCQYWAREDVLLTDTGPKKARGLGLAFHDVNELVRSGEPVDLDAIAASRELTAEQREDLGRLLDTWREKAEVPWNAATELTFAFDARPEDQLTGPQARILGNRLQRRYTEAGMQPWEIPGTVDLVWVTTEGPPGAHVRVAHVPDIKTGAQIALSSAAFNDQALFNGMCAIYALGADIARLEMWHVTQDDIEKSSYDMDREEARLLAAEIREEMDRFTRTAPEPNPGPHCKSMWCPAVLSCTAAKTYVEQIIPADQLVPSLRLSGPLTSAEEAAFRLRILPLIEAFVKESKAELEKFASTTPVPTEKGPWGPVTQKTESIIPNADACGIIEDFLGEAGVRTAIEMTISKASIERAVREAGMRPITKSVDAIVKAIREAGAVANGTKTVFTVRKDDAA